MDDRVHFLPLLTSALPAVRGILRREPEDFVVEEIPAYDPLGHGDHLFVRFRKRNLDTRSAVQALARALQVSPRDAGYAGMKDKRAVTTQWASFPGARGEKARSLDLPGIDVLEADHHPHKLRLGHLRGNRFRLLVRDPSGSADDATRILEELTHRGCPNFYGHQRFGADNLQRALAWADGGAAPSSPFQRKLYASTLQSAVFNEVLAERVTRHEVDKALPGDIFRKESNGGLFDTDDLDEAQERVTRFDISPTGPMPGPKMRQPTGEILQREEAAVDRVGISPDTWRRLGRHARGTRRALRVQPTEVSVSETPEGLAVSFRLPPGAYATTVMREVMEQTESRASRGVEDRVFA